MNDMTSGKPFSQIIRFGFPLFLGSLLQQSYILIDSMLVGQLLGPHELAAIGIAGPLIYLVVSVIIGLAIGFAIHIAYRKGAGDEQAVQSAIRAMFWLFVILGLAVTFVAVFFLKSIVGLMGVPYELVAHVNTFAVTLFVGILFQFLLIGLSAALRALGDSVTPLYSLLFSSLLNVALDILFMVPLKMGLLGAAIGTIITQVLNFILLFAYLLRNNHHFSAIFRSVAGDWPAVKSAVKMGVFPAVQHILLSSGILILVGILTPYGTSVIAAATLVGRIETFVVMFFAEMGSSLTTFVAQNSGKNRPSAIREGLSRTMVFCSIVSLVVSALLFFFPEVPARLFTNDADVLALSVNYLRIAFPFFICLSLTNVLHGYLNGIGKTQVALICTLLAFVLSRVPLSWLWGHSFGVDGLWWAAAAGWAVGLAYTVVAAFRTKLPADPVLEETAVA